MTPSTDSPENKVLPSKFGISAFHVKLKKTTNYKRLAKGANALFWINRCVDTVFVMDMTMQFFIMYPVTRRFGSFYVSDKKAIVMHYLRSWFGIDFISIIPFELIGVVVSSGDVVKLKALRAVRLLRLLKLIRIVRGFRILHRWEVEMTFSYRKLTLWGLLVTVCLAAHWMSCVLGMINSIQGDACYQTPEDPPDCVVTWFSSFANGILDQGLEVSSFRAYLASLHVTATILVHPYQAAATSEAEQVCFTILVFLGGFIWTRVISRTTAVQTSLDRHGIYYRQTMDDLNMNVNDLMLSADLQKRLRSFFTNTRDTSQRSTWADLTKRMSPCLQNEVAVELHKVWLRRVPFLAGSSRYLIADLARRITTEHYAQRETFGSNFRLYVMNRGLCSRTHGFRARIRLMLPGSVWGMEHLVFYSAHLFEPNSSTTITFCEVLVLTRDAFEQVKVDYPENNVKIRKFFVKMVVIRGIIAFARECVHKEEAEKQKLLRVSCRNSLVTQAPSQDDLFYSEGSDSEEHSASDQHHFHRLRMQREMTRRLEKFSRRRQSMEAGRTSYSTGNFSFNHENGTSIDVHALQMMEDRLAARIDAHFSVLQQNIESFKKDMREDMEASGFVRARHDI